ncbi:uncharacterized protein LOC130993982 [Salvia miltiorrhiza]|uniref:uncharacterized protein LOC130993982 n=1 Tax=Salvia miltiorrhiza TaxID=226208 RepID=UPI0025AD5CCE|nr:uncharacterized protein LOC130993982 [Salvia miltiorrhiza]
MAKGFYTLVFTCAEDKALAKQRAGWELSKGSLRIREWVRFFDPYKEISSLCHVWVRLYYLPIELWHPEVFAAIGRTIGLPIRFDSPSAYKEVGHFARILVEVDLAQPLQESMTLGCGTNSFYIEFYYEQLPLYYSLCKITGHNRDKCNKCKVTATDVVPKMNYTDANKANNIKGVGLAAPRLKGKNWQPIDHNFKETGRETLMVEQRKPFSAEENILKELEDLNQRRKGVEAVFANANAFGPLANAVFNEDEISLITQGREVNQVPTEHSAGREGGNSQSPRKEGCSAERQVKKSGKEAR